MDVLPETFTLGDEKNYKGFYNKPLSQDLSYRCFVLASLEDGDTVRTFWGDTAVLAELSWAQCRQGEQLLQGRMTAFSVKEGGRLHGWPEGAEAAVGIDLINGVFGGKWHHVLRITDECGGQCQHTRSAQAQFWLAGLCSEPWRMVGMGSHSALVRVSVENSPQNPTLHSDC